MMKNLFFLLIAALLFSCSSPQTKVYQWRGENRLGIFPENNLLKIWPEDGPTELWYTENIGDGYGTPTVTETEIFITGAIDSMATLFCIDLSGVIKWQVPFGKEWVINYPGSRSQPTVVDDLIYLGSGMGNLFCLNRSNGEVVWEKRFMEDFNGIYPRFGHSEAPVIAGDKVFWTPGGKEYNVVALNRFTGKLFWSNKGHGERSGYNPGTLIRLPSRQIFVTFSAYNMMGFDTETGELLWTHAQDNVPVEKRQPGMGDTHSNCVVFDNGYIYYAAGDGNGGVKLELNEDGSEITEVWRNKYFDSYMGGIVKIDNYLYGSATSKKLFRSINATTGQLCDSLKLGWGAVISADDMLYYYGQNGSFSLVDFNETGKMTQVSSFKINRGTKEHFSHPVIKNGILYQRHGQVLMAFDIGKTN
ncbi:PQQ-binding-like beta-propeller repeat protein [uncultured Draconibacterium sp.]|mgnify:CR=1 FL=1|uniref:outer membrane protein assembly factor BamB family protein n=1 Tax=uncultured Draconibacterium sp. TaxID=1573823 RepID=UPI0025F9566F|nr:PQQ-binding-like beta-propeller repeat protein [uncultured Draconibacterium sp.]